MLLKVLINFIFARLSREECVACHLYGKEKRCCLTQLFSPIEQFGVFSASCRLIWALQKKTVTFCQPSLTDCPFPEALDNYLV